MRIDTPEHLEALRKIVPIIPWSLQKLQSDVTPDAFRRFSQSTRASMVHDLVFDQAEASLTSADGIVVSTSRGLRQFCLEDVLVRLHIADGGSFRVAVNRTNQTEEWNAIPHQASLAGIPDPNVRFHLVYAPDETWTKLHRCAIGLYQWDKPKDILELDTSVWDVSSTLVPELLPISERPTLKIKPREVTWPLEGLTDGTGS